MSQPYRPPRPVTGIALPTQDNTDEVLSDIHSSSEIWALDSSFRAGVDISCIRLRGHCYRQVVDDDDDDDDDDNDTNWNCYELCTQPVVSALSLVVPHTRTGVAILLVVWELG
jgi:hypothetical protein